MSNSSDIEETGNNNRSSNNEESNRPACAACKHQRKKCRKGCLFLIHFPSDKQQEFSAVHQIFGIANVTKMMKDIVVPKQSDTVASIIWESMIWTNKDQREYGPLGVYKKLEEDYKKLLEENKQLKENFTECQKQQQQLQEENKQLKENFIKCQQQQMFQCQCQSVLPVVHVPNSSSRPGGLANSGNNNNNAIQFERFPQQRLPEQIQAMVPQNTMPQTSRTGLIHSSNSRLNRQRYEPYHRRHHHQSPQFIGEGEFVGQQFALSNQSQDNNFANRGVFGQQNPTGVSTPVQNNFTAEQQTQWKSS